MLLALGLVACGGGGGSGGAAVGESTAAPDPEALELGLRRANGEWIHIGDLRGRPLLLFVFGTYDAASQAAIRPLTRFAMHHPDVHVIGIAAQPDAPQLLEPYEAALRPIFPLTYDPARDVHHGTSPLGRIEGVPMFIMIDARGFEVERHVGYPSTRTLDLLLERARARGGEREDATPPLLGEGS